MIRLIPCLVSASSKESCQNQGSKPHENQACKCFRENLHITLFVIGILTIIAGLAVHFATNQPDYVSYVLWIGGSVLTLPALVLWVVNCCKRYSTKSSPEIQTKKEPISFVSSEASRASIAEAPRVSQLISAESTASTSSVQHSLIEKNKFFTHIDRHRHPNGFLKESVFDDAFFILIDECKTFLDRSVDVEDRTILHYAVFMGQLDAVRRIHKANPHLKDVSCRPSSNAIMVGETPFELAERLELAYYQSFNSRFSVIYSKIRAALEN